MIYLTIVESSLYHYADDLNMAWIWLDIRSLVPCFASLGNALVRTVPRMTHPIATG